MPAEEQNLSAPSSASEDSQVEIMPSDVDTRLTRDGVMEACRELQLVDLNGDVVKSIAKLGIAVESAGSVQFGTGGVVLTQLALVKCLMHIRDSIVDEKTAYKAQKPLCEIAKALTGTGHYMKTRVATNVKAAPGPTREEAFNPDEPVRPMNLTQINIHEAK